MTVFEPNKTFPAAGVCLEGSGSYPPTRMTSKDACKHAHDCRFQRETGFSLLQ